MHPTFTGDREFIFISRKFWPRVGDVVCLKEPNRAYKAWDQKHPKRYNPTKRIAGIEGYCGYMKGAWRGAPDSKVIVPRGYCWTLGDNRSVSRDSRHFGPVPLVSVMGKIMWRLGPEAFNFIDHDPNYEATTTSQSPMSTTGQPIRTEEDLMTPESSVKLILKTIPPTITGLRPHLRYKISGTKKRAHRSESVEDNLVQQSSEPRISVSEAQK